MIGDISNMQKNITERFENKESATPISKYPSAPLSFGERHPSSGKHWTIDDLILSARGATNGLEVYRS